MGRLVGIHHFFSDSYMAEEKDYVSRVRRAKKDGEEAVQIEQVKAVTQLQSYFSGHILRRTIDSKSHTGSLLLDLPPYKTFDAILTLTDREMTIINEHAEKANAK